MEDIEIKRHQTIAETMVKHDGVISNISGDKVTVSLTGDIHCDACNAKSICGAAESNSKEIEIQNISQTLGINEKVTVLLKKDLAIKAVFYAYLLPFIILLTTLLVGSYYFDDLLAGLLAIAVLIPYYMMIYLLRDSFKKEFKASILKTSHI